MASSIHNEESISAAKLPTRPVRSILKSSKSLDHSHLDSNEEISGISRSESKR